MKKIYLNVACAGMDVHYKFSNVTFRDPSGKVVRRQRLDHRHREELQERLNRWPTGIPVVMEASFGWGWLSDLLEEAGHEVQLSNCYKVEQMRKARGWVKTNKKDADLISLLPFEQSHWWKVWRAPPDVRNLREQMRFRGDLVGLQTMVRGKGRKFLAELCLYNPTNLSPQTLLALRGQVKLVDHLRRQLADVARILHKQLVKTPLEQVGKFVEYPVTVENGMNAALYFCFLFRYFIWPKTKTSRDGQLHRNDQTMDLALCW